MKKLFQHYLNFKNQHPHYNPNILIKVTLYTFFLYTCTFIITRNNKYIQFCVFEKLMSVVFKIFTTASRNLNDEQQHGLPENEET